MMTTQEKPDLRDTLETRFQGHIMDSPEKCWCNPAVFTFCRFCQHDDPFCEHCGGHGVVRTENEYDEVATVIHQGLDD